MALTYARFTVTGLEELAIVHLVEIAGCESRKSSEVCNDPEPYASATERHK